jgi:Spy/CpxP family protein refolding chaperone
MPRTTAVAFALAMMAPGAAAQHAQHLQPYAGLQARPIKALSAEQIADLRAGRGMGFAMAAELNGYPGPRHVIELADALKLTAEQRAATESLFHKMQAETIPIGERLIAQEAELDRRFAEKSIDDAGLIAATQAIGATEAALRAAHLRYHLVTAEVLTPEQILRYAELRGYAADGAAAGEHGGHAPQN